jgi:hypothetical protein
VIESPVLPASVWIRTNAWLKSSAILVDAAAAPRIGTVRYLVAVFPALARPADSRPAAESACAPSAEVNFAMFGTTSTKTDPTEMSAMRLLGWSRWWRTATDRVGQRPLLDRAVAALR